MAAAIPPVITPSTRVSRKTYCQVKNIRCQESTKQCSTKALKLYPRMIHTHPPIRQTTKHDKKKGSIRSRTPGDSVPRQHDRTIREGDAACGAQVGLYVWDFYRDEGTEVCGRRV